MTFISRLLVIAALLAPALTHANTGAHEPKQMEWAFDGAFGKFDKPAVQRGLQVYKEVCSACHSLKRVPFRALSGIGLSAAEAQSFAAGYTVKDGPNDAGEMFERPGMPSDKFPGPYANDNAARASNNGALPPDLSLIVKAREDGANYVYSILTGYGEPPAYRCTAVKGEKCVGFSAIHEEGETAKSDQADTQAAKTDQSPNSNKELQSQVNAAERGTDAAEGKGVAQIGQVFHCTELQTSEETDPDTGKKTKIEQCRELGAGMHFNRYFPGMQIAMPVPLRDESVTYQDAATKATLDQEAYDVVSFLQWAAEPEMEERKRMGIHVILFLGIMTCFFYVVKKRIWSDLH